MATNEGFHEDPLSCEGYSQLMDSDMGESFIYSPPIFHSAKPPTMLCFGNVSNSSNKEEKGFLETGKVTQKSGITGSDSSSASSSNNSSSSNSFTKSKRGQIEEPKKTEQEIRNGLGSEPNKIPLSASGTISGNRRTNKKPKKENPTSSGPVKVRKEKLGERITALQQLVSPFGKTDTASVLHEAMGYIRFLHDQVQVLSSPYLQKLPSCAHFPEGGRRRGGGEDEGKSDLRSRGLCLVPVEYTVHVANCNGADLWSPAAMGNNSSSCSKN